MNPNVNVTHGYSPHLIGRRRRAFRYYRPGCRSGLREN
jgi:hypothetical protein